MKEEFKYEESSYTASSLSDSDIHQETTVPASKYNSLLLEHQQLQLRLTDVEKKLKESKANMLLASRKIKRLENELGMLKI